MTDEQFDSLYTLLKEMNDTLNDIKSDMPSLSSHDLGDIHSDINRVIEGIKEVKSEVKDVADAVNGLDFSN